MLRIFLLACASVALMTIALGGTTARAQWAGDVPGTRPSNEVDPATLGDQFFHVEWSAAASPDGHPRLTGYVYNDYEEPAVNVQLRIHELDSAGREITTLLEPVDETVPAKGRAYFDVPVPDSASYRVDVVSFEFIELSSG
jgi:hypothetical protein